MFCPGFRPSATSNSVASAACSQMLGTSARSAAVKFSSTYAAGSLRPADGRCRCAPAESRRCPRDDTADFKPRWYTDPFTTPPTPEVQRSRRKRDRRAYGRAHQKLPAGTRRQTWLHRDESGSAILGGRLDEILGTSPRQAPRGPRKVHQTAPRRRCSSRHQCNPGTRHTAVDGVSEEPALPLTSVCQIGHRSRAGHPCSRTETACWVRPSSRPAALNLPVCAIANNTSSADNSSMWRSAACA